MAEEMWLVSRAGQQYRAPDLETLQDWVRSGSVNGTDMIWRPDRGDWLAASELPELAIHIAAGGSLPVRASVVAPPEQRIVVVRTKNVGLAVALAVAFGPLGLFYSSISGGVIMFFVNLFVGFVTLGFGLFLTWPICGIWAFVAAARYNENILAGRKSY